MEIVALEFLKKTKACNPKVNGGEGAEGLELRSTAIIYYRKSSFQHLQIGNAFWVFDWLIWDWVWSFINDDFGSFRHYS